jgi:hypothetical protein
MRVEELESALHAAMAAQPDVSDPAAGVARRVHTYRRRRLVVSAAVIVGASVIAVAWAPWRTSNATQVTATATTPSTIPPRGQVATVAGVQIRFSKQVGAPLPGSGMSPMAVPSPDGAKVFYVTDTGDRPELRVLDIASGSDSSLIPGGYAPALDASGHRLAYGLANDNNGSITELRIRDLVTGVEVSLGTRRGIMAPVLWAGSTLVWDLWTAGTIGQVRQLELTLDNGTTIERDRSTIKAVSDDGTRLLVSNFSVDSFLEVLDARSGQHVAQMSLSQYIDGFIPPDQAATIPRDVFPDGNSAPTLPVAITDYPGVWTGSEISLPANPTPVVMSFDGASLRPEGLLNLPVGRGEYVESARPAAPGEVEFITTEQTDGCDLATRTCHAIDQSGLGPLRNPSR